jgi:hypothetical protein
MSFSILAVEVAPWQLWSLPLVTLVSVGVGLALGWFLAMRHMTATVVGSGPHSTGKKPASVHDEKYWAEKRSSPRFVARSSHVQVTESPGHATAIEGVLLNRSLGGLGLSVDRQFQSGKILHVKVGGDAEAAGWVRVEVRYCRFERGRWTLGCKFLDEALANNH